MASTWILVFLLLTIASSIRLAFDPSPLQDICVADLNSKVRVNGFPCKDPKMVTIDDFTNTWQGPSSHNQLGTAVTPLSVVELPGVNTLGVSSGLIDYLIGGVFPAHYHPRGSEILTCIKGTIYAGVIVNKHNYAKVLKEGDNILFPIANIHFHMNVGNTPAIALAGFNSQLPGVVVIATSTFATEPLIDDRVLANGFRITTEEVDLVRNGLFSS